jgi:hypothetical protein
MGGMAVCDYCGEKMYFDVYLIYVLAGAYCPECFEEWKGRARRYASDLALQNQNDKFWYKAQLPDLEVDNEQE